MPRDRRSPAILKRFGNIGTIMEQADVKLSGSQFLTICIVCASIGSAGCFLAPIPNYLFPIFGLTLGSLPIVWLLLKRKKRMNQFTKQLPEAMPFVNRG